MSTITRNDVIFAKPSNNITRLNCISFFNKTKPILLKPISKGIRASTCKMAISLGSLKNKGAKKEDVKIKVFAKTDKDFIVSITDNGIGISKKELKLLFDKFYRVGNTEIHNVKGLGLGLYYANQIIKAKADRDNYMWHSFWLIIRNDNHVVVGSADFKDIPNEMGEVEIGYGLEEKYEHQGCSKTIGNKRFANRSD